MAAEDRAAPADLAALGSRQPRAPGPVPSDLSQILGGPAHDLDFFAALRRLERAYRDKPRIGEAVRPGDEPIRLGQDPSLAFAPSTISGLTPGTGGAPPRLSVLFFGVFGPNGPMPLHLTEYARDRLRNAADPTLTRFADIFHHRFLELFYRAWAKAQPTVSRDRPEADRFSLYVGSLVGLGLEALHDRDTIPDTFKLHHAGRLGPQVRNADGLAALVSDFLGVPADIEEFIGDWVDLPPDEYWHLGVTGSHTGRLGLTTSLGPRVWMANHKFRVALGPLDQGQFQRLLPGGEDLPYLKDLVRNYVGDELAWDVRLILGERVESAFRLGGGARLGLTSWVGRRPDRAARRDVLLDPELAADTRAA